MLLLLSAIVLSIGIAEAFPISLNPAILQDSRDLPKVDGRFGFLYRTEDGIAHAAKGEPGGQVHGRFTYTDPTGLKVNFNYNAGSKSAPGYNYNEPLSAYEQENSRESLTASTDEEFEQKDQYDEGFYGDQRDRSNNNQQRSRPPSLRSNTVNAY